METLIRWLVKKFLKQYHLAKNPKTGTERKRKGGENGERTREA